MDFLLVSACPVRRGTDNPVAKVRNGAKAIYGLFIKEKGGFIPAVHMEEMTQAAEVSGNGVYEVGFIIVPETTEEKLPEVFGSIKDAVLAKGAAAISEEFPKLMTLAYTMEKTINNKIERFKDGYFGWIKFEAEGAKIAEIDAMLRLRTDIVRHLITSTVRENTIASKRAPSARRRTDAGEGAPEMTKAEIDREIDALVDTKAPEASTEAVA